MIRKWLILLSIVLMVYLPLPSDDSDTLKKDSTCSCLKETGKIRELEARDTKTMKFPPARNYDQYKKDEANRVIKVISKDKGEVDIEYDEYGNLKSKTRSNKESEHYFFDKLDRITRIEYKSGNIPSGKNIETDTVDFKYSTAEDSYYPGNLIEKIEKNEHSFFKYTARKLTRETKVIRGRQFVIGYRYNDRGLLSDIDYPSGLSISYKYNDKNKIVDILASRDGNTKNVLTVLGKENPAVLKYGNGLERKALYDTDNNMVELKTGDLMDMTFNFDKDGLIHKVIDKKNLRNKKEFFYDNRERLITAYGPWGKSSYRYDDMDNIILKEGKNSRLAANYHSKSGRIKELLENDKEVAVEYDQLGRMLRYGGMSFKYNTRGRLEKIENDGKTVVELFYNYRNQRVCEKYGAKEYYFIYDQKGRVISQYDNDKTCVKEYFYSPKGKLIGFLQNNKIFYYHYDLMNFPVLITDETGKIARKAEYTPYGKILSVEGEIDDTLRFPGQFEISGTDIYYNLNRSYFPLLTRYLEPDPIENDENNYQYALSNPLKYYDLEGLQCKGKKEWTYSSRIDDGQPLTLILKFQLPNTVSMKLSGYLRTQCYCKKKLLYMFRYEVYMKVNTPKQWLEELTRLWKPADYIKKLIKRLSEVESKWHVDLTSIEPKYGCPTDEEFVGDFEMKIDWEAKKMTGVIGNLELTGDMEEEPVQYKDIIELGILSFSGKHDISGWFGSLFNLHTNGKEKRCGMECDSMDDNWEE